MRRAFITGCTGFLGATIAEQLIDRGVKVIGLRRPNSQADATQGLPIQFVTGSLFDQDLLIKAMQHTDVVFHVAGAANYWQLSADTIYHVNVDGTHSVLQAAIKAKVSRVVFTSSTAALGIPETEKPLMDEDNLFNLHPEIFPYGHSKYLAEQVLQDFTSKGLDIVSVLPSAVMGSRDIKFNAGELIVQTLKPSIKVLPVPPGGLNFIDVHDCAAGHLNAAELGESGRRYILSGHNLTHKQTFDMLQETLGIRQPTINLSKQIIPPLMAIIRLAKLVGFQLPLDPSRLWLSQFNLFYDNSRARNHLNLSIRPFTDTIRSTYDWYQKFGYLKHRGIYTSVA